MLKSGLWFYLCLDRCQERLSKIVFSSRVFYMLFPSIKSLLVRHNATPGEAMVFFAQSNDWRRDQLPDHFVKMYFRTRLIANSCMLLRECKCERASVSKVKSKVISKMFIVYESRHVLCLRDSKLKRGSVSPLGESAQYSNFNIDHDSKCLTIYMTFLANLIIWKNYLVSLQ